MLSLGKKITQKYYSIGRIRWDGHRHYFEDSPDGALFSQGRYPTTITEKDLPEHFVPGYLYRKHGFLSAKGVKDLCYRRTRYTNHLFKDDSLFVSYDQPIHEVVRDGFHDYEGYDYVISGWMIVNFIKAVDRYSDFDTTPIKRQINDKLTWYHENWSVYREVDESVKTIFEIEEKEQSI